jgi:hypothetical protein
MRNKDELVTHRLQKLERKGRHRRGTVRVLDDIKYLEVLKLDTASSFDDRQIHKKSSTRSFVHVSAKRSFALARAGMKILRRIKIMRDDADIFSVIEKMRSGHCEKAF